jgi:energy-coupling factor transporter ATP-binding protein EcfA2
VFSAALSAQLHGGSHLILYGPRGSGKSTLLAAMRNDYRARLIPCAIAARTSGLSDIVTAMSQAYPEVDIEGLSRRAVGLRLRMTADRHSGVLLLDHTREVTTAMVGFLRRIRGGIIGALIVADIDSDFERERLRNWRRHALCMRMPLMSNRLLRRLLLSECVMCGLLTIDRKLVRQIIHAARGRVGWLNECVRRLQMPDYWNGGHLRIGGLCTDTEIAIREGGCGPRMSRRSIRAHIGLS